MLVPLTLKLIAVPELAWPRLTAACDRGEPLPSPILHASAVAGISVVATGLGMLLKAGVTVGSVTVALLAAVVGYVGSAVLAVTLAPKFIRTAESLEHLVPRYTSAVAIPVIATGLLNLVPLSVLALLGAVAGCLLTFRSGSIGARDFLGLEGKARQTTATVTAAFASTPILFATLFRTLL